MKLVVFAHVPPPHHGQVVMVQLMLEGLKKCSVFSFQVIQNNVNSVMMRLRRQIGGQRSEVRSQKSEVEA